MRDDVEKTHEMDYLSSQPMDILTLILSSFDAGGEKCDLQTLHNLVKM